MSRCSECHDIELCAERRACQFRETAARLYPDNEYLQTEWLRALQIVRQTSRGWLLDQPMERRA